MGRLGKIRTELCFDKTVVENKRLLKLLKTIVADDPLALDKFKEPNSVIDTLGQTSMIQ